MSCHVMSCHVMSCRHYCINSKKSFSKTFSFHKIIYKYFAGFLACIKSSLRGYCRSNPQKRNFIILDCFAPRCVPHSVCFSNGNARNDNIFCTRCAPHGDNKNFQFDKFQRLLSVIYKKLIN